MNYIIEYPADPDCPKCKGTGTIFEHKHIEPRNGYGCGSSAFSYTRCDCHSYENIKKVQDRCNHKFVCRECGKHNV